MFLESEIVLKKQTTINYLLHIFFIIMASIHYHGFPLDLSVVLLKLIMFFISGVCEQLLRQGGT